MSSLPDRPDLRQLRIQAKELKRAVAQADAAAIDRVSKSHPRFAGLPAVMEGGGLTLRDAQVTIAREHGFESWRDLLAEFGGDDVDRWREGHYENALGRAFKEAQALHHSDTTVDHLLLAVLAPAVPTIAQEVLETLGFTHAAMAEQTSRHHRDLHTEDTGTRSTPAYHSVSGFAQGMALGLGSSEVTDEHVLLAVFYSGFAYTATLFGSGVEADEIVEALKERGVAVPRLAPPVPKTPTGPFGPVIYFPEGDWSAVVQAITKEFPPGTARWGTNRSHWKEGFWNVHGEDEIPMERLVRSAVTDPRSVSVVQTKDAWEREQEAREPQDRDGD